MQILLLPVSTESGSFLAITFADRVVEGRLVSTPLSKDHLLLFVFFLLLIFREDCGDARMVLCLTAIGATVVAF